MEQVLRVIQDQPVLELSQSFWQTIRLFHQVKSLHF